MSDPSQHPNVVEELRRLIRENQWEQRFKDALASAQKAVVDNKIQTFPQIQPGNPQQIIHPDNLETYYKYVDWLVHWIPRDVVIKGISQRSVYNDIVNFYFILAQEAVSDLQVPIQPESEPINFEEYPLSKWIVDFANQWGAFLDTPESAAGVPSFEDAPEYNWDEYMPPPSGYRTFNQFFARHVKPGMRPIAGLNDPSVIVSPADCTFAGWWQIGQTNQIIVKGIQWSIEDLLKDCSYAERFKGGVFTHSFLNTYDYHRWHTPVEGTVLETKVVQALCYLDVGMEDDPQSGDPIITAYDGTGYQFLQTRGIAVIDSPIGLVACIPMGMAQVSSVVFTADVGVTLHKGEELGYFQFGGSDFVMLFERAANVRMLGTPLIDDWPNVHVQQGTWVGNAYPYSFK
ncbi:MAG: phosphatidylserine decarboxylase [Acidobacteriota bacterium]